MTEITEAQRDQIYARAFGHVLPPDPAVRPMTVLEAEEIQRDEIYAHAFRGTPPTAALLEAARSTLAAVQLVESDQAVAESQASRLEVARLRVENIAVGWQGKTRVQAEAYSRSLIAGVQKTVITEGKSFEDVVAQVDRTGDYLRNNPVASARASVPAPARSAAESFRRRPISIQETR